MALHEFLAVDLEAHFHSFAIFLVFFNMLIAPDLL